MLSSSIILINFYNFFLSKSDFLISSLMPSRSNYSKNSSSVVLLYFDFNWNFSFFVSLISFNACSTNSSGGESSNLAVKTSQPVSVMRIVCSN